MGRVVVIHITARKGTIIKTIFTSGKDDIAEVDTLLEGPISEIHCTIMSSSSVQYNCMEPLITDPPRKRQPLM